MARALVAFLACAALSVIAQTCVVCGEVRAIREVNASSTGQKPQPGAMGNPSGVDTPPVVGTVAQFRFGAERDSGWHFGAAGTPEMQTRLGETTYELVVAMDGGDKRTVQRKDGNRFHVGQRVALRSGELEPM